MSLILIFKTPSEAEERKCDTDRKEEQDQAVGDPVSPGIDELSLEEPEIVKQGGKFGVRLRASAPSIHMICNKLRSLEAA